MEQNFEDWKKNNPNGTLNDYYKLGHRVNYQSVSADYTTQNPSTRVLDQNPNYNLIMGLTISLIGFIGYFLPWFKLPIFNISISGNDLMQLANLFKNHVTESSASLLRYTFVIPVTYGIIILGAISKSYMISVIGIISNLFVVGFFLGKIFVDIPDLTPYMNIGIYLIALSWLIMIYYLVVLK